MTQHQTLRVSPWWLPGLYFASRVIVFLSIIPRGVDSFGDLNEYYAMALLPGWPYFHYWSEYPPLFAMVNELIFRITQQNQTLFFLLFSLLLAAAGGACLLFFQRIAERMYGPAEGFLRSVIFFGLLVALPYTWWNYDILPLGFLLAGVFWSIQGSSVPAGIAIGLGMLTKWFPGFALAAILRYRPRQAAWRTSALAAAITGLVFGGLYLLSPVMTRASLAAQPTRTSWQTVWAYLDKNRTTGWFVHWDWRLDPQQAYVARGNPPVISTRLTSLACLAAGLFFFWRVKNLGDRSLVSFIGITFVLFLIWSPGWSPQWVIYLVPLILLTLPLGQGLFLSLVLLFITLFEYPYAISLLWFRAVFAVAGVRMLVFALLLFLWYRNTRARSIPDRAKSAPAAAAE